MPYRRNIHDNLLMEQLSSGRVGSALDTIAVTCLSGQIPATREPFTSQAVPSGR
jgi:hypothetical protein